MSRCPRPQLRLSLPCSSMLLVAVLLVSLCCALPLVSAGTRTTPQGENVEFASQAQEDLLFNDAMDTPNQSSDAVTALAMSQWKEYYLANQKLQGSEQVDLLTALPFKAGMNTYTMARPEGVREYHVYVPKSYAASRSVSLILSLHGLTNIALEWATRTNLMAESERWGFIVIFPQGSKGPLGTSWNAGTCCADQTTDDIGFLTAVIGLVRGTFNIRSNSIHSMGFSNGGFMTERLGCELGATFTSIASIAGGTILQPGNKAGLAACDAVYKSPVSILHVHGDNDWVVPWTGDALLGFPTVPDNMAAWVSRNKCTNPPVQTLSVSTFTNQVWSGCGFGGATVELVKNSGGGHIYPRIDMQFDVTDYLLKFWHRVTPGGL